TAAQVRNGQDASHFHPDEVFRLKRRSLGNVEPAVTIKISGRLAVPFHSSLVGDEHWDARAVAAFVKDLLSRVIARVKFYIRLEQESAGALVEIVTENLGRCGVAGERVKRLTIFPFTGKSGGRAKSRQRNLSIRRAVQLEQLHRAVRVLEIERDEVVA